MENPDRKLSIIIVAYNEAAVLPRVLKAVSNLDRPQGVRIETLLVDGGSSDGTVEVARAEGVNEVLEMPGASIPVCRNAGLDETESDWVAFIDADCEPAGDWLTCALPFLQQEECVLLGWPVTPPIPGTWVQRAWQRTPPAPSEERHGQPLLRDEAFRLISTRNLIMHREAGEQLDGFDVELSTGEDTDFVFRAAQQGVTVLALPGLRMQHHGEPATLPAFFRQQLWHANRSSYTKILEQGGGKTGGQLPKLTLPRLPGQLLLLAAYALAQGIGFAGLARKKISWKSPRKPKVQ